MRVVIYHLLRGLLSLSFLLLMVGMFCKAHSQQYKTPTSAWILPGISWQHSSRLQFLAQAGINEFLDAKAVYLQGFYDIGKHITLNPAYLFLDFDPDNAPSHQEHTWMQAVIFKTTFHRLAIDNRSLFWNRLRPEQEDLLYYRNRFRLTMPVGKADSRLKLYLFDEPWFLFSTGRWMRNRVALGMMYRPATWLHTDVSFALENDHYNGHTNLFFFMVTLPLHRKKAFSDKKQ